MNGEGETWEELFYKAQELNEYVEYGKENSSISCSACHRITQSGCYDVAFYVAQEGWRVEGKKVLCNLEHVITITRLERNNEIP